MISSAYANTAPAGPDPMFQILMLVGFIAIFYFLLWRPQQKRAKEHKNLIENLAKGDEIATGGGLMGADYPRSTMIESAWRSLTTSKSRCKSRQSLFCYPKVR